MAAMSASRPHTLNEAHLLFAANGVNPPFLFFYMPFSSFGVACSRLPVIDTSRKGAAVWV
jgi:hypothetical protein